MQIIPSTPTHPRHCKFGDFEIVPDQGWELSQVFLDYESQLLVVSVCSTDQSTWVNNGYGGRTIPTKEYKVDRATLKILTPEEWQQYFNYEPVITLSDDGLYKLITQRIREPKRNSDGIREELYEVSTNKRISTSDSVAFSKDKRETLLESLYRTARQKEKQKQILDAKPALDEFYQIQLSKLVGNEAIIAYSTQGKSYKLMYAAPRFDLLVKEPMPATLAAWEHAIFRRAKSYKTLEAFWREFTTDEKWFMHCNIHRALCRQPLVLAKFAIGYFNDLRRGHQFTYAEYDEINRWSAVFWSDQYKETEFKQWCALCRKEVSFQARYPKYICGECMDKPKLDSRGNHLEFSNLGFSGGFLITYSDVHGNVIREDDSQSACRCFIEGNEFVAREAKFGGIVIQRKE